jgi:hypothetical protein
MFLDPLNTGIVEIGGFSICIFPLWPSSIQLLMLRHVLGREENEVDDSIDPGVLLRYQDAPDLLHYPRIFKLDLDVEKLEQGLDTDETNIPGVSGAPDLGLQICGVRAANNDQD